MLQGKSAKIKGEYRKEIIALRKQGFERIIIDGITYEMDDLPDIDTIRRGFEEDIEKI